MDLDIVSEPVMAEDMEDHATLKGGRGGQVLSPTSSFYNLGLNLKCGGAIISIDLTYDSIREPSENHHFRYFECFLITIARTLITKF